MNKTAVAAIILVAILLLVSCMKKETAVLAPNMDDIEGVHWYLTEVTGAPVSPMADDKQPHILLDPALKRATGYAGCNNFFGSYELDGALLTFGPIGQTRMACPDLETGLETNVFEALGNTRKWKIEDGDLLLFESNAILARFSGEK
jgi:heat shock protein HslJ